MGVEPLVLVGWKDICRGLGGISRWTAMRWTKKHGLPVVYDGRTATLEVKKINEWLADGAE